MSNKGFKITAVVLTPGNYLKYPAVRKRALTNCYNDYGREWSTSLKKALRRAFMWHRSPEGFDYWQKVYDSLS